MSSRSVRRGRSSLENALIALWECIIHEPEFLGLCIGKPLRNKLKATAKARIPQPADSAWVTIRAWNQYRRRYDHVDDLRAFGTGQSMEQSMPPEWRGHKDVDRILVYHEAYKAGPHVEMYIVVDNDKGQPMAYNVGVKRLTPEHMEHVKKRSNGELTNNTREYLIDVMRQEYENGAWLAQTTDHTPDEARMAWTNHAHDEGYGAGESRHILLDSRITVHRTGQSIEFWDPELNPRQDAYVYRVMDARSGVRPRPILNLGFKKHEDPGAFQKLHLKGHIGQTEYEKFQNKVGPDGIVTLKEDGASVYFESGPKGTRYWSPRVSKVTGYHIRYDNKVRDLRHITSDEKITGMGELTYLDRETGRVLRSHEIGGYLNSHEALPSNLEPQITIYRIDKVGRKNVLSEPYVDNLVRVHSFVDRVADPRIRAPRQVDWVDAEQVALANEGLVGVPEGKSILEGRKYKPRADEYDWTVTSVDLEPGPKGGIAGVVWFKNDRGDEYKIGASSMGNRETVEDIMENPDNYVGKTARVHCYQGHEGRAARFVDWHLDKGVSTDPSG